MTWVRETSEAATDDGMVLVEGGVQSNTFGGASHLETPRGTIMSMPRNDLYLRRSLASRALKWPSA